MRIATRNITSNVIYTAILIHAVIVVAAPACVICLLFYIGSRTRRVSNVDEDFFDPNKLRYDVIGFSLIGIFLGFLILYIKNAGKKMVVAVEFNDDQRMMVVEYKTFYRNKIRKLEINYDQLSYRGKNPRSNSPGTSYSEPVSIDSSLLDEKMIVLMKDHKYAAEIPIGGTLWDKEGAKIKVIVEKMNEIKSNT